MLLVLKLTNVLRLVKHRLDALLKSLKSTWLFLSSTTAVKRSERSQ